MTNKQLLRLLDKIISLTAERDAAIARAEAAERLAAANREAADLLAFFQQRGRELKNFNLPDMWWYCYTIDGDMESAATAIDALRAAKAKAEEVGDGKR